MGDKIVLTINGKQYEVGSDVSADTNLADYLHDHHLTDTRVCCGTGGCGACTVFITRPDPDTGKPTSYSALACLVPVAGCGGWSVTTASGVGNKHDGFHAIQDSLVQHYATQCGYCTPGIVMNMYELTQQKESWSAMDVEARMDANLCRCTGYRPILDALKAVTVTDIEDSQRATCPKTGKTCKGKCSKTTVAPPAKTSRPIQLGDAIWHQPTSIQELLTTLQDMAEGTSYRFVCSDTGKGVFGNEGPYDVYISTLAVPELSHVAKTPGALVFGANVSLTRMMEELKTVGESLDGYGYAEKIANLWKRVGGTIMRNMGSWAGNLAIKVAHRAFPSDVFLSLMAAGATVITNSPFMGEKEYTLEELLDVDMKADRTVLIELRLPPMPDDVVYRIFKITPRAANNHAYLNAAFRIQVDTTNAHTVVGHPWILFGGINETFLHAWGAESMLEGKSLEDEALLADVIKELAYDIVPDTLPENPSPEYRVALAQNLMYKTILGIVGGSGVDGNVVSGGTDLERGLSSGQQSYQQYPDRFPLTQAVPKHEGHIQCSGEAEFVGDLPKMCEELVGWFVTSTRANARIVSIDTSEAMGLPGIMGWVGLEDITGVNNIQVQNSPDPEPLFAEGRVSYHGQPLGLVVGKTREECRKAAKAVKVTYEDEQPPVLTIREAMERPAPPLQPPPLVEGDVAAGFAASTHVLEGVVSHDWQYHFHMENQSTLAVPRDDGLEVFAATQWASETQRSIGQVLGMPDSSINVNVKRTGGAFGAKITRSNIVANAACLAARKLRRPVRLILDLETNMTMMGGRDPFHMTYKVGVDSEGRLQAVQATVTSDAGYLNIDPNCSLAADAVPSCYNCPNWEVTPVAVLTNTPNNTWCRTPGSVEGITLIESIMEHIADVLGLDPLEVRQRNLMPDGGHLTLNKGVARLRCNMSGRSGVTLPDKLKISKNMIGDMIDEVVTTAEVEQRKQAVKAFNQSNLWKKRGLSVLTMGWPHIIPLVYPFNSLVNINGRDGSVAVAHGGTEIGQGLNTKAVQVAAYELGCPMEMVTTKPANTVANANCQSTSGALGSYTSSYCVSEACKKLRKRLDAVRDSMGRTDVSWQNLIAEAVNQGVDLSERYSNAPEELKSYPVFAVVCAEVELDVLTGQFIVLRADILEDVGTSMSPLVDVGQIEGGFVMGQGLFCTEKPIYEPDTGKRITTGTWHYQPPTAHDIPLDLRVKLTPDTPFPGGVLDSKVSSEPPVSLAYSVVMALRNAVASARRDAGVTGWFNIEAPYTVEKLQRLCMVDPSRLVLHPAKH